MKHMRWMFYMCMALMVLLAACTPSSTPTSTGPSVTSVPVTSAPVTAPPTAAPTTVPLDLTGPPMQVGSSYLYFDGTLLVAVPGGPFIMGHGGSDDPEHTVTLSDFWIYSTKVTNREFQQCVAMGKCTPPDLQDNLGYSDFERQSDPVVGVTWAQGEAYCEYANGQLPTEAQWEKAARGPDGYIYPWGNGLPAANLLNFNNNIGSTSNVINYPPGKSYYDALDMEGNVYEWVYDWYDPLYYHSGPAQDPLGPTAGVGGQRSVRSAGYRSNGDQIQASARFHRLPRDHARDLGFRCVVKDPFDFAPMCQLTALIGGNLNGSSGSSGGTCQMNLNVSVNYSGCGSSTTATITFDDSSNPDPNANITGTSSCTSISPGNHYAKYSCGSIPSSGFSVGIDSKCPSASPPTPTCPAHYKLTGGACVWDGSGTAGQQCPAGAQYDSTNQCCASVPGTGANFPACPAGTFFQNVNGMNECEPSAGIGGVAPASASVDQQTCPKTTGGGPSCPSGQTQVCNNYGCVCR